MLRRLIALSSFLLCAPACTSTPDITLPERALAIHTDDGCRAECGVVAQNRIELRATATGDLARTRYVAESASPGSARVADQSEECTGAEGSPERVCDYLVVVDTLSAGDVRIMFRDPDHRTVDAIALLVREAGKLVVDVNASGPKQTRPGRSIVFRNTPIDLGVTVLDGEERMLRYGAPPWTLASSDPSVVAPDPLVPTKANARDVLGSATLTLSAGTASHRIEVDVVDP